MPQPSYFWRYSRTDPIFKACWTSAQKFVIIRQALTPSIACQQPNDLSSLCVERPMKRRTGPPPIYLASSGTENLLEGRSEERLLSLLATLEECRAFLADKASPETGKLLSLAILELRMELHHVTAPELK